MCHLFSICDGFDTINSCQKSSTIKLNITTMLAGSIKHQDFSAEYSVLLIHYCTLQVYKGKARSQKISQRSALGELVWVDVAVKELKETGAMSQRDAFLKVSR